ncbi:MAG: hypothetical protein JST59_02600 [Actinobacteria bacterium]|nr:hypothetical protein [Actinomycetota bacterium]
MQLDQFQFFPVPSPHNRNSPKAQANNRIPMWLFTGEFKQEVKDDILAGRLPL